MRRTPRLAPALGADAPGPPAPRARRDQLPPVNDARTLAWCANLAALELHPFLHRAPHLAAPDCRGARLRSRRGGRPAHLRARRFPREGDHSTRLGLQAFPKVSGSRDSSSISRSIPRHLCRDGRLRQGDRGDSWNGAIPIWSSAGWRRFGAGGKVLIDWSQNLPPRRLSRSIRLRGRGPSPLVSMPVTWEELRRAMHGERRQSLAFTPAAAIRRLAAGGSLRAPAHVAPVPAEAFSPRPKRRCALYRKKRICEDRRPAPGAVPKRARRASGRFVSRSMPPPISITTSGLRWTAPSNPGPCPRACRPNWG